MRRFLFTTWLLLLVSLTLAIPAQARGKEVSVYLGETKPLVEWSAKQKRMFRFGTVFFEHAPAAGSSSSYAQYLGRVINSAGVAVKGIKVTPSDNPVGLKLEFGIDEGIYNNILAFRDELSDQDVKKRYATGKTIRVSVGLYVISVVRKPLPPPKHGVKIEEERPSLPSKPAPRTPIPPKAGPPKAGPPKAKVQE